jgi:hypothetical protein
MVIILDYAKLSFYDKYVISIVNSGVNLSLEKSRELTDYILKHYGNKPFIYVSHRIHSYAVDPNIYRESSLVENLIGFAFVSENKAALNNAKFEKEFLDKPIGIFNTIEETIPWINKIFEDYNN